MTIDKRVFDKLSEAVGWTPLVKLHRSLGELQCTAYAKIEFMNPMGSVKDRIARHMIQKALQNEEIKAGDVIVENSSGNTAMGMAMMAACEGLKCKMVVRASTSKEKLDCLRAVGVDLCLVDGTLPPDHPESYNRKAVLLAEEIPNSYYPDQHNNRENNRAHYETTGPEIWQQMDGRIDYFVAGIGTGGTICGAGRYLKEQDPNIKIVAVDPEGSVFYEYFKTGKVGKPGHYLLEGLGDEEIIKCPEFELIDEMVQISDKQAFLSTRELAKSEAILAGGSSGAALYAVRQIAQRELAKGRKDLRLVTIFPDSGSRYLSTIFNDDWLREKGFIA